MKITTGLVPRAQLVRIPPALRLQRFEFAGGDMALRVPPEFPIDVWAVRFDAPLDTAERPAGTPRAALMLDTEPLIEKRGAMIRLLDEHAEAHEMITARERERCGAPDDAVVSDRRNYGFRFPFTERRIEWWEVTA